MKKSVARQDPLASKLVSKKIAELGGWRGETLGRMRKLIKEAVPDVVEELKWLGTPLKDAARLFNSSLDGKVRRAIDIREGEAVAASAIKALVREAAAQNSSRDSKLSKKAKS